MNKHTLPGGAVHPLPDDLRRVLTANDAAEKTWHDITPLARNEWICWIESAKQTATRQRRIERTGTELSEGMRRPCCWPGCGHSEKKKSVSYITTTES